MATPLRVLVVDDSEDDAELLLRELRKVYAPTHRRVWGADAVRDALAEPWDLVVSDWSMPDFTGLDAFRIVQSMDVDIPFILVSGTIDEDLAVHALKSGVHDFMSKGRYARLLPSVGRELREADMRRHKQISDDEVRRQRGLVQRSEDRYRMLFENSPQPMWIHDRATLRLLDANVAALGHYGYTRDELLSLTVADLCAGETLDQVRDKLASGPSHVAWKHRRKDGARSSWTSARAISSSTAAS